MISDYIYGPIMEPFLCFDARFAKKHGIAEAIVFTDLYHEFYLANKSTVTNGLRKDDGWMWEGGYLWRRYATSYLFGGITDLFDAQQHIDAVNHLCNAGLLRVRPSMTDGYYWVSIGEEQ